MFCLFIIISAICASVIFTAPVKRSIDLNNPCFVLAEQTPSPSNGVPLSKSIKDLIARTSGLKIEAENIQTYLVNNGAISSAKEQKLKDYNGWIDDDKFDATAEQKLAAVEQKISALKAHFHLIAEHLLYINQARTNGQIAEISGEAETRQKLQDYETELESAMCSLKIAILSSGSDVTSSVSESDLDSLFLLLNSPLENDTQRTYIAVQDGVQLMEFLNTIYKEIELSLDDTEA
ncbi:uncharacterized protein LOC132755998 isoform X2 [Ruditapes philippinarum]|uniref:uncharacterized protein LOC132755998 isoform X2 n=1 Tax=Ruditapes philippinarum TaxID=129788 RepID=UPI00295AA40C|nr:uncharacterized protein LOC132755998 isoform X2 [Ruditapes philippinarum]